MVAIRKPFFVMPADLSNITASQQGAGAPASNVARLDSTGLIWRCETATGDGWVRGQMPAGTLVDFFAMIACITSPTAAYRLRLGNSEAEVTGGSAPYDSGVQPFFTTATSIQYDGRFHSHLELPQTFAATWFQMDWIGPDNIWFEVTSLVLGRKFEPSRFYDKDFERGFEDLGSLDINRFGVADVVPGKRLRTLNFTLGWLNEDEYETRFAPMAGYVGTTRVIYCCFDPALSPYRQNRTYLGWLRNPPFARGGVKPRTFSMEFQIRSLI